MELQITQQEDCGVVTLPTRLAMANASELRTAIHDFTSRCSTRIVLNMEHVQFVDSSGLSVLVSALKKARSVGGDAVLLRPSEQVMALIMLTRLHEVFAIHDSLETALAELAGSEGFAA